MSEIRLDGACNTYRLEESAVNQIAEVADWYLSKLKKVRLDALDNRERLSYLGVVSEACPLLQNQEFFLETCQRLLTDLRSEFYENRLRGICLYDGLCNLAVFTEALSHASGCYQKFCRSLLEIICGQAKLRAKMLMERHDGESFLNYDAISGLSGVGHYLLGHAHEDMAEDALRSIAEYFVLLCRKVKKNDASVPGWFEWGLDDRAYPNGYFDFSVSHGIAGPLSVLIHLWKENRFVSGQKEAVLEIVKEYAFICEKFQNKLWSGKVSMEQYVCDAVEMPYGREGWCYGSITVANILSEAMECVRVPYIQTLAEKRMLEVAEMDVEALGLQMPILCHGYAGTSAVFRKMYDASGEEEYLKQAKRLRKKAISCFSPNSDYGFPYEEEYALRGQIQKRSIDKLDFLEGSAGILMELLAWIKPKSCFERMLLL